MSEKYSKTAYNVKYTHTHMVWWINCRLNCPKMKITMTSHFIRYIHQNYIKMFGNIMDYQTCRDELISDVPLWTPTYGRQNQDDQHEHTYGSYVRIRDIALKTCQRRWTIGRSGERGSGISVLAAWHDDDEINLQKLTLASRRFWNLL